MIHLTIDRRETRSEVPAALAALGVFSIEWRALKCGDYLIDNALLLERKTLPDLVSCIKSGRLFAQALRLRRTATTAAMVLEGTARDLIGCDMRWEAIQGALVTLAVSMGLPILRTRTTEETAKTLLFAAEQHRAYACGALQRKGRQPSGKTAQQTYFLQGLPGIGPERARRLLRQFGSAANVINTEADTLAEVSGIGTATATRIRWAVEEDREPCYPVTTFLDGVGQPRA